MVILKWSKSFAHYLQICCIPSRVYPEFWITFFHDEAGTVFNLFLNFDENEYRVLIKLLLFYKKNKEKKLY